MKEKEIETIHESLVNGNRVQMIKQIEEYGHYDFWSDYRRYLAGYYDSAHSLEYFTDATIAYFRIKGR